MDICSNVHLSNFIDDTKLGGVVDIPYAMVCHVYTTWMCLNRLKKRFNKNLMKFNKGQRKVLYLGRNSPMYLYKLRINQGPRQRMIWWPRMWTGACCAPLEKKKEKRNQSWGSFSRVSSADEGMRSFPSAHLFPLTHRWDTPGVEYNRDTLKWV